MSKIKTCVYAISLNEIGQVDNFMEASKDADLILVCDTGSTDGTIERLRELGATVYEIKQKPWRFDIPRNTALSLIPPDIDFCLSIDIDEYLQPGWLDAMQEAWDQHNGNVQRMAYDYTWNWKADGSPDKVFFADKMHHRKGYRWRHPCHETLYWDGPGPENRITVPGIKLHHRADNTKSRSQYLGLLKLAVDEDPSNDRMAHYYARECMFMGQNELAIEEFKRHLSLPNATWAEERCASLRYISRTYGNMGKHDDSIHWAHKAVQEWQWTREPWLELARAAYRKQDWPTCYWAAAKCLAITGKGMSYITDSECWGSEPHDLAALGGWYSGLKDAAREQALLALTKNPTDARLKSNCLLMGIEEKDLPK
jgi:glycosyltransferase involved in cell wall biosynthesis